MQARGKQDAFTSLQSGAAAAAGYSTPAVALIGFQKRGGAPNSIRARAKFIALYLLEKRLNST
jgi:hypothetical protein